MLTSSDALNGFSPNGRWFGDKQTGFQQPESSILKRNPVELDFISPAVGSFAPNANAFGDREQTLQFLAPPTIILADRNELDTISVFIKIGFILGSQSSSQIQPKHTAK